MLSTLSAIILLSLSFVSAAPSHNVGHQRHPSRLSVNALTSPAELQLGKRFSNARFSWYDVTTGATACGPRYGPDDFIVAVNSAQFAGSSHCFNTITITANGKTAQAQIVDECPGCPANGLDLTKGLFSYFGSLDAGEIYGTWDFGGGKSSSSRWDPPSTTSKTPTPTPIPQSSVTISLKPSSSMTPITSSTTTTSSFSTSLPSPTPSIPAGFLGQLNLAVGSIGAVIVAGQAADV